MKKILLLVALFIPALLLAQKTETRKLSSFSEVHVSQSIKLTLKKGNTNSAEVSTNGDLEDVVTKVSGNMLKVEKDQGWSMGNSDRVEVIVTYTGDIEELKASSSAKIEVADRLKVKNLSVKASSSGRIQLAADVEEIEIAVSSSGDVMADINAEVADLQASSSGQVNIRGNCNELEASVSSSGSIRGNDFVCKSADLQASSSGSLSVYAENQMSASASSSGTIKYGGSPKIKSMNSSSGGKIKSVD